LQYLRDGLSFEDLLDRVPDEFYQWVEKTKNGFLQEYNEIETICLNLFTSIKNELNDNFNVRKEFALKAKDNKYRGILFNMYDGKIYSNQIWDMVKCDYQKPFLNEENN
jgi:RNA ligase